MIDKISASIEIALAPLQDGATIMVGNGAIFSVGRAMDLACGARQT